MAYTILIVDDNEAGLCATSRILKQGGFEVKEAATGGEALKLAAEEPDAIVLDVNLPDISGFEVCRRIKSDPATASIPILHLSATYMDPESAARSLDEGAQAYLTQPIEPPVLISYIKTLLRAREAEEALAAEKERLEVTLRSIGDGVITTDIRGRIVALNNVGEKLTGWDEADAIGRRLEEVFHIVNEKTRERCPNPVRKVLETGQIIGLANDTILIAKDGTERVLADSGAPIQDEDGSILGVVLTFRDQTAERASRRELEEKEQLLQSMGRIAKVGGWEVDAASSEVQWTVETYRIHELPFSHKPLLDESINFFHEEDRPKVRKAIDSALQQGVPFDMETRFTTANGKQLWTRIMCESEIEDGKTIRLRGTIQDITERKTTEEQLRQAHHRLDLALEAGNLGLWDWNTDTDEVYYDERWATMLGYSSEDIEPHLSTWERLAHPDDKAGVLPQIEDQLKGLTHQLRIEQRLRTKSGDWKWILAMGTVIEYNPDGSAARILGIHQDISETKRAQEELRQNEEKFRSVIETMPVMMDAFDEQGNIILWNRECERVTGYSAGEIVGNPEAMNLLYPAQDYLSNMSEQWSARGSDYYDWEWEISTRDGEKRTISWSNISDRFPIAGWATWGFGVDVTRRKNIEDALLKSEQRYRTLFEQALDAILIVEAEGKIVAANPSALELFGATEAEVIGADVRKFYWDPADRSYFRQQVDEEGYVRNLELRARRKDGSKRYCLWNASQWADPAEGFSGYLSVARDITERRQAEKERLRLSTAMEQSIETVLITDTDGRIVYVNPACERITGYRTEEIIGRNPRMFKSDVQDEAFYEELWRTISGGEVWVGRITNKKKDGSLYEEEATISPVKDEKGTIVNYCAVKRDVTENRLLERQVREAQKMEAIGTLAGGIAHDFNNLLQVISGYSELLLTNTDKEAPGYTDLKAIHQAAFRGHDLVKQILAFSRKLEPKFRGLSLNDQVLHAERMLYRTIPKMIEIERRLDRELWYVEADPSQIEQVLFNLAINSRDAMPDGGILRFETQNVYLDAEYARMHLDLKPGEYVMLSVSDTGTGMGKAISERVFEPFFSTKVPGEGTGLGLAMVYGIVKSHGGQIHCYSELGEGTSFKIYLPATERKEQEDRGLAEELPVGGAETILIADDEPMICQLAERILTKAGYTVLTANSGIQALEVYTESESHIDLVILDLIMPEMGGRECLEELLKINPEIKVLIASGFAIRGETKTFLDKEAKGRVEKPFRMGKLLRSVRHVLDGA